MAFAMPSAFYGYFDLLRAMLYSNCEVVPGMEPLCSCRDQNTALERKRYEQQIDFSGY